MSGIKHWGFVFTLFILTSVFYFQPHQASASTIVTNDITTDTTWTLTDSPYVLQNSLYILEGSTLTIEAGVIVKIDGHQGIYVEGSIVTNGTDSLPVTFTSFLDDIGGDTNEDGDSFPFNGDWSEIHVNDPTSGSSFSNTNINYSYGGLAFENTPSISISNLGVNNFVYDGLTLFDDSHAIVDGFSSDGGNDNIAIFNNSSGEFTNVSITNSGSDESVVVFNDSSISIEDGVIENSFGDGIVFFNYSDVSVNNVTLENLFGTALMDIGTNRPDRYPPNSLNISNSIIKNNITGFEFWLPTTALSTSHNSIFGNLAYGVVNYSPDTNYNYNFENNWWGDASGPYNAMSNPAGLGDAVSDNVLFDPWCQNETCAVAPEGFSSVLFLPGLKASRLYAPRADGSEDQLWEPNGNSDVEYLYLNTDGTSRNSNVYTREIIEEANVPIPLGEAGPNIYKSFAHMLYTLFDERKIADWKAFPYDWRQSVDDIVNNGTKYEDGTLSLTDTLESLVDSSLNGKVTIIAHSNGGLLAKALLKKLQDDKTAGRNNLIDSVDVLILVGVPEIGTPVAVPAMLHGYDQEILGGWLIDEAHARELGRNMLGAFGLLPSREYINRVSASPVTFVSGLLDDVTKQFIARYGPVIDSYAEYKDFLQGAEGRTDPLVGETTLPINLSPTLFSQSESLHDSIDAWTPPTSMRVIEVAGWGIDTLASFEYYPRVASCPAGSLICDVYALDERPRFTVDGDGTVVVPSAQYMSSNGNAEKYWVDIKKYNEANVDLFGKQHKNILEINNLLDFISSTIQNLEPDDSPYITTIVPTNNSNILRLSIHSPVTIDAYDKDGNHTGKICPPNYDFCYAEENIVNSSYLEFGEGKYINLPEDEFSKVKLQGTDVGTFTYDSEKVLPNGTSSTSSFIDIPVTTQTQAEITINPTTQNPQLKLDVTGDGIPDFTLAPSATFDPITYLQIMKATIDSLDLTKAQIRAFDNRVDNIIKSIQSGKINKAKLKSDKFKSFLEKKLAKPDPKKPKPKKLSKTDAQLLLDMLNKLLDNIN